VKLKSQLEFDLRMQEFIALAASGRTTDAILYTRKHLAPATITVVAAQPEVTPVASASTAAAVPNVVLSSPPPVAVAATTLVCDAERLRVLQEAMSALIFFDIESNVQKEDGPSASSAVIGTELASTPPSTASRRYGSYWSLPSRFSCLASAFARAHLELHGYAARSTLEEVTRVGLAALKSNACRTTHNDDGDAHDSGCARTAPAVSSSQDDSMRDASPAPAVCSDDALVAAATMSASSASVPSSLRCPSCASAFASLALTLPVSERLHSHLLCRLSGLPMDDANPPLALPSGYVYSRSALQQRTSASGVVTCPATGREYNIKDARIAYVL
jgi:hypothetical protein